MSRQKRRSARRQQVPQDVQQAYSELLQALSVADRQATERSKHETIPHEMALDLSEAGQILSRYPRLASYLAGIKQREDARLEAMNAPDLALRAPTGSSPQASTLAAGWSGSRDEPVGVPNYRVLRDLADRDPWVRAAINVRRQQIGRADIAVVPANPLKPYNKKLQKKIQNLLDQPNELRDTYRSLIEPVLEDVLVLDRGVLTKNMSAIRQPQSLYYEDGATIKIYPGWNGNPNSYRYLYEAPGGNVKIPLRNDECIVFIANQASHRYGLSPVQVLYDTIQADLSATKSAKNMVDMKPPPHILQIVGATDSQIRRLRAMYEAELAGRRELFLLGGSTKAEVFPLTQSARDNQWLEWQVYLVRKIAAVFQVSPQQLGVTFDINKSTGDTQQQIFEDTGLIPLLLLLEEQLNRELLADFAPQLADDRADLNALNLRIIYPEISESARQLHAERAIDIATKGLAGLPSMTMNQVLLMRGEEPVDGGDTFYLATATGAIPFLSYDGGNTGDYTPVTTGGQWGAQDAAGGPIDNADTAQAKPASNVPPAQAAPPATQPAPKKHLDTRAAGKRWLPSHIL